MALTLCVVLSACQLGPMAASPGSGVESGPPIATVAANAEREGNHAAAAQQFLRLFDENRDNAALLTGAGRNLRYAGRPDDAEAVMMRFYEVFEDNPDYRLELGKIRIAIASEQKAIEDLMFVTSERPSEWEAFSALGIAHDMAEDYSSAKTAYEEALRLSGGDLSVLNNYAISMASSGDIEGAIDFLRSQPRAIRRSSHIRQNLAMFLAIQGDMDTAAELARMDLDDEQVSRNLQFYEGLRSK